MAEAYTQYPGAKTYTSAAGHLMVVDPTYSQYSGEWFYIYANAGHSDDCECETGEDLAEFAGEEW